MQTRRISRALQSPRVSVPRPRPRMLIASHRHVLCLAHHLLTQTPHCLVSNVHLAPHPLRMHSACIRRTRCMRLSLVLRYMPMLQNHRVFCLLLFLQPLCHSALPCPLIHTPRKGRLNSKHALRQSLLLHLPLFRPPPLAQCLLRGMASWLA